MRLRRGRVAIVLVSLAAACAGGRGTAPRAEPALAHVPADPADLSVAGGRIAVRLRAPDGAVRDARVVAGADTVPMHVQLAHDGRTTWRAALPRTVARYAIVARTRGGMRTLGPFDVPAAPFTAVAWVGGAVGYEIFPDRFANGDTTNDAAGPAEDEWHVGDPALRGAPPARARWDAPIGPSHCCHQWFGGDLAGVAARLDHLRDLGVTLVWLTPIWRAGSAHGYDTHDHMQVAPAFGDERVLRALLDSARVRGIRVLWDFVPNHVGVGHAAFRDAVARGAASPYRDWFRFRVPPARVRIGDAAHYATFANAGAMPRLHAAPSARAHLMAAVRKWTGMGFAGIRVDVPFEVDDGPGLMRELRRTAKSIDSTQYLVGEFWEPAPAWVRGDGLDATMNYAVGHDVIERFVTGAIPAESATVRLARVVDAYPEASVAMAFNVIATHDAARLLTKMGGGALGDVAPPPAIARARLATAMQYALPGVPVTFQGDECGLLGRAGGEGRDEQRRPIPWDRCDAATTAHLRTLAALRRAHPAFTSPALRLVHARGAVLAFARGEPGAGEGLAVFHAAAAAGTVPLPPGEWRDAATGARVRGPLTLPSWGWRWLVRTGGGRGR